MYPLYDPQSGGGSTTHDLAQTPDYEALAGDNGTARTRIAHEHFSIPKVVSQN